MSMQYIRDYYGVPAKRGLRVEFEGKPGVITSASGPGHYLRIRLDGEPYALPYHPTWHIAYVGDPDWKCLECRGELAPGWECTRCGKVGADPDPEPIECPRCEGTGSITGDRFLPVNCGECNDGVIER